MRDSNGTIDPDSDRVIAALPSVAFSLRRDASKRIATQSRVPEKSSPYLLIELSVAPHSSFMSEASHVPQHFRVVLRLLKHEAIIPEMD